MGALAASRGLAATIRSDGLIADGKPWATHYYVAKSDRAGPTVVVTGGVHGDEPAGAAAAEQIAHWPITSGTLIVLPRANPAALAARTRNTPGEDAGTANLNRDFPTAGSLQPAAGERAQAIWQWLRSLKPEWYVDLHEGTGIRVSGSTSVGSSVIVFPSDKTDAAARIMLAAVNATIDADGKKFIRLAPPVNGSLARAAGEHLGARAMIAETSIHDLPPPPKGQSGGTSPAGTAARMQPLSQRVRQHRLMVSALLAHLGMLDSTFDPHKLPGRSSAPERTWVALYDAGGTGGQGESASERILTAEGMVVVHVGAEEIQAGTLDGFDLVEFPGGSGSKEAAAIGPKGRDKVREFVEQGGGYLGICAGAYLAIGGFDWSLKILNAKTVSPQWQRGAATVKIELTPEGRTLLGDRAGLLDVKYHNGPIITRAGLPGLSDYQVLASFRTEVNGRAPANLMVDSPAIAAGRFGKGHVVIISPHPEHTRGLEDFVCRAVRWAAAHR
jgi:hypothetical protein